MTDPLHPVVPGVHGHERVDWVRAELATAHTTFHWGGLSDRSALARPPERPVALRAPLSDPDAANPVPAAASARLELDPEQMRALGYRVVDAITDHIASLSRERVEPAREHAEAGRRHPVLADPPAAPAAPDEVLDEVLRDVLGTVVPHDHPRFFAMVPSPSNFVAVMADALSAGFNVFCGLERMSPGAARVELEVLEWLRRACGLPEGASGVLTSGGSAASLLAIAAARRHVLGDDASAGVVYCSTLTHPAVHRAVRLCGLGPRGLHPVPVNDAMQLDIGALRAAIESDRGAGRRPFCVVATAGTTDTGTVDELAGLADLCAEHGLWLHVDGAFGGAASSSPRTRRLFAGLGRARSVTLDPHKWLFQPYEIGCLLVRDPSDLEAVLGLEAAYFRDHERERDAVDFKNRGLQLTRSFKALKLWMSVRTFGMDAFRRAIEHGIDLAETAEQELRRRPGWRVVTPASLAVLTFRCEPDGLAEAAADGLQRRLAAELAQSGLAMLNTTVIRGRVVLRMCTINPRTTEDDVRRVIDWLDEQARVLCRPDAPSPGEQQGADHGPRL